MSKNSMLCFYNLDYREFLSRIKDRLTPNSLVFLDPPYTTADAKRYYAGSWTKDDDRELLNIIQSLPCDFILTVYDYDAYSDLLLIPKVKCMSSKLTLRSWSMGKKKSRETVEFVFYRFGSEQGKLLEVGNL
jgi:site-specific DNA-adenine methylase